MMRLAQLMMMAFVLCAPQAPAQTWITQQRDGQCTAWRSTTLDFGVINGNGLRMLADAHWSFCPDETLRSGWRAVRLFCDVSVPQARADIAIRPNGSDAKRAACAAKLPTLTLAAVSSAWSAIPPLTKRQDGLLWADHRLQQIIDQTRPPAPRYVVAEAPANAKVADHRPTYTYRPATSTSAASLIADGQYVREGTDCTCWKALHMSGSTRYCNADPAKQYRVAVCTRAP